MGGYVGGSGRQGGGGVKRRRFKKEARVSVSLQAVLPRFLLAPAAGDEARYLNRGLAFQHVHVHLQL